jgi:hypothetical protein
VTFTFFACRTSRAAEMLKELLGTTFTGVIHCDRARRYWCFGRLQWCWAHVKRDFLELIDAPCITKKRLGHDLMKPTKELFALWKKNSRRHGFATHVSPTDTTNPSGRGHPLAARPLQRARTTSARSWWSMANTCGHSFDVEGVANQQCHRASVASPRDLAQAHLRHAIALRQSIRRVHAARDRVLPPSILACGNRSSSIQPTTSAVADVRLVIDYP